MSASGSSDSGKSDLLADGLHAEPAAQPLMALTLTEEHIRSAMTREYKMWISPRNELQSGEIDEIGGLYVHHASTKDILQKASAQLDATKVLSCEVSWLSDPPNCDVRSPDTFSEETILEGFASDVTLRSIRFVYQTTCVDYMCKYTITEELCEYSTEPLHPCFAVHHCGSRVVYVKQRVDPFICDEPNSTRYLTCIYKTVHLSTQEQLANFVFGDQTARP